METKKLYTQQKRALFAVLTIGVLTVGWVGFCFMYRGLIGNSIKPIHPLEALASGITAILFVITAEVWAGHEVFKK